MDKIPKPRSHKLLTRMYDAVFSTSIKQAPQTEQNFHSARCEVAA
jgi:hypothetical protein